MEWISPARSTDKWRELTNMEMNLRVLENARIVYKLLASQEEIFSMVLLLLLSSSAAAAAAATTDYSDQAV